MGSSSALSKKPISIWPCLGYSSILHRSPYLIDRRDKLFSHEAHEFDIRDFNLTPVTVIFDDVELGFSVDLVKTLGGESRLLAKADGLGRFENAGIYSSVYLIF